MQEASSIVKLLNNRRVSDFFAKVIDICVRKELKDECFFVLRGFNKSTLENKWNSASTVVRMDGLMFGDMYWILLGWLV